MNGTSFAVYQSCRAVWRGYLPLRLVTATLLCAAFFSGCAHTSVKGQADVAIGGSSRP